jgi:hypothetical protein
MLAAIQGASRTVSGNPRASAPSGPMPNAAELARLVPQVPPRVTAVGVADKPLTAAMLCWGLHAQLGWNAGIAFIYNKFSGSPLRALITVWLPADHVHQQSGDNYAGIPRITLDGPPTGWPTPPGRFPNAGAEWENRACHSSFPDPTGEYRHLREQIRRLA